MKQGAVFTLETGSGPDPANLQPTSSTCTTDTTGACTLTTTAVGTYWVVETSTPKGDAPSEPVQVTATASATVTATVTMVPAACSATSTGASGQCVFTYFAPPSKIIPKVTLRTKDGLESFGYLDYSYDVGTHVVTMKIPGTTVPSTAKFDVCYGAVDMTFGLMTNPATPATRACGPTASGYLPASFAAHETSYSGTPVSHTAAPTPKTKTKGYTVYQVTIPSGAYWYLVATCGGKLLQVADPAATPTPAMPTLATSVSAAATTVGAAVSDAATVTGTATTGAPAGTVTFTVCGPTSAPQPCAANGQPLGSPVVLAATAGAAGSSTATSASFTPSAAGTWCFAAVYTPAAGAPYATVSDDVSGAPVPAECVTVTAAVSHPASVAGATTVSTGMPWAGSRPFVAGGAGLGAAMVVLGGVQRRRYRRLSKTRR